MRKSDRLFQLTNILRKHQPITASALSQKLGVSERTVYRYIDDLSVAGIPVYGEPGIGYRLSEGFELPPLQLTSAELEALVLGVGFATSLTGSHLTPPAHSLLAKVEAVLPSGLASPSDSDRVVRIPALQSHTKCSETWGQLHSAIKTKQWLNLTYHSLSDKTSSRNIFPLGLFYWGGKWTLGAWCDLRNDYRDFRVDCIRAIDVAQQHGLLPQSITLAHYIETKSKTNP